MLMKRQWLPWAQKVQKKRMDKAAEDALNAGKKKKKGKKKKAVKKATTEKVDLGATAATDALADAAEPEGDDGGEEGEDEMGNNEDLAAETGDATIIGEGGMFGEEG